MNIMVDYHAVKLRPPFYKREAGTQLHRYLIPDFISRFQQDLGDHLLGSEAATLWQTQDRFSRHDNSLVLRLPMHKTFYLVSCEVVCDRLGTPALDENRITSAGFVIRRLLNGREQSWMIENDEPMGWEDSSTGLRDPDVHRRMCRDGSLHPREDVSTYSGEETHPMHAKAAYDENGKRRTVIYGYLPLGGSFVHQPKADSKVFDDASLLEFTQAAGQHLPWPFGVRVVPARKHWKAEYTRPLTRGKPSAELFELLRLLVNRYHLGERGIDDNQALKELTQTLYFYRHSSSMRAGFNDASREQFNQLRKYSLYNWLKSFFRQSENSIVAWINDQEKKIEALDASVDSFDFEKLPAKNGNGLLEYSLYVTPSDAREFRSLLGQRVLDNAMSLAKEMPVPKFQQAEKDTYQVVPFVRAKDDHGKERIYWSEDSVRSEAFRVAAPFDPNASRPSVIQMPSLSDLRSGLAKGASMITPPDTFNLINALNLKKGASEDVLPGEEPGGIGIQWICSFSLPVITLVAMILLMIMISLLNIVFFWLPWVKICLPFPKIE